MDTPAAHEVRIFHVARFRWRLHRDQLLFLFVSMNLAFLIFDVWIAHSVNAFRPVYEWIPIAASWPGIVTSFWMALSARRGRIAQWLHVGAMLLGVAVGILGMAFHLQAAVAPAGPLSWAWIVFSAPVLAPLSFAGVCLVGLVTMLHESPPGSGQLWFTDRVYFQAPINKTQHLLWLLGLGLLGAAATSFIDHGQYGYTLYKWIPVFFGLFAGFIVLGMAMSNQTERTDEVIYLWIMLGSMVVGLMGFAFHLSRDMADNGATTFQRMQTFAPIAAPMLFADLGMLGLIVAILSVEQDTIETTA